MVTPAQQPECRETTRSLLSISATAPVARRLVDKAISTSRHPAQVLRPLPLRVQQLHSRQRLHQRPQQLPRLQLPPRLHLLQRLLEVPHPLQPQRLLLPRLRQLLQDLARQQGRARYRGLAQHRHPAPRYSRKSLGTDALPLARRRPPRRSKAGQHIGEIIVSGQFDSASRDFARPQKFQEFSLRLSRRHETNAVHFNFSRA